MTTPIIHVIDDEASVRAAIDRVLQASGYRVALYESGNAFLEQLPSPERACILLDVQMPGSTGLELQQRLSDMEYILPIVFLTSHGDIPTSVQAIKGGAEDFLCKPAPREELCDAIERALLRYDQAREQHDRTSSLNALVAALTPREGKVFALFVRGKLNKQIAYELGVSERTIKASRHSIMQKLGIHSLPQAVSIAERLGMLAGGSGRERL